jgi:hypothetical protein
MAKSDQDHLCGNEAKKNPCHILSRYFPKSFKSIKRSINKAWGRLYLTDSGNLRTVNIALRSSSERLQILLSHCFLLAVNKTICSKIVLYKDTRKLKTAFILILPPSNLRSMVVYFLLKIRGIVRNIDCLLKIMFYEWFFIIANCCAMLNIST